MKYYDFNKAKQLIDENADRLAAADLGIHEDWFWTAENVFKDGAYTKELFAGDIDEAEAKYEADQKAAPDFDARCEIITAAPHLIGGIAGSTWGTPTLHLQFKDETEKYIPVFNGESEKAAPTGEYFGCLSGPVQASLPPLETE